MNKAGKSTARRLGLVILQALAFYVVVSLCVHSCLRPTGSPPHVFVITSTIAATGSFLLSRRWITSPIGSFIAGALYGFCPLAIGLLYYPPLASVPFAITPWFFLPAAFWRKTSLLGRFLRPREHTFIGAVVTAILCLIPAVMLLAFFQICAHQKIFPLPLHNRLSIDDITAFVIPLAASPHDLIFSLYHVPLVALVIGTCMYVALNRPGIAVLAALSLLLSFVRPLAQVSPIVWSLIPLLFGAIIAGLGAEGLAWAGPSDRKWVLLSAAVPAVFSGVCLYLWAGSSVVYRDTAILYAAAASLAATIYFLTKANLRLHALRWLLICAGIALDVAFTAAKILSAP